MSTTISPSTPVLPALWRVPTLHRLGRALIRRALDRLAVGRLDVIEDGGERLSGHGTRPGPHAVVRVLDPSVYSRLALGGAIGAAEAYIDGLWTSDDLPRVMELLALNASAMRGLEGPAATLAQGAARVGHWLRRNTRAGSRRNVVAHYDLSNDFFALFLDPDMVYSSAFYTPRAHALAQAQEEKIDRACRKLALTEHDHLLEIGTGWGALAIHAARRYGCRVTTTTISDQQHELARRRIDESGLAGRITLLRRDYRDLEGTYTKLVSIEMVEAVGREYLGDFLAKCASLLTPEGVAVVQGITIRDQVDERASRRVDFLKKYIFPGSCLLGMARLQRELGARTDLDLFHVEHFGEHYARTLAAWRQTFHANLGRVRALGYDDRFVRMWDYYFAYCQGAMQARYCSVAQLTLAKPRARPAIDWDRAHA